MLCDSVAGRLRLQMQAWTSRLQMGKLRYIEEGTLPMSPMSTWEVGPGLQVF